MIFMYWQYLLMHNVYTHYLVMLRYSDLCIGLDVEIHNGQHIY